MSAFLAAGWPYVAGTAFATFIVGPFWWAATAPSRHRDQPRHRRTR